MTGPQPPRPTAPDGSYPDDRLPGGPLHGGPYPDERYPERPSGGAHARPPGPAAPYPGPGGPGGPYPGPPPGGGPYPGGPPAPAPYPGGPPAGGPNAGGPPAGGPYAGGPYPGGPDLGAPPAGGSSAAPPPRAASAGTAHPAGPHDDIGDVSVGELVGNVTRDLSTLIRQELALAQAEIKAEVGKAGKGAGALGAAGAAGYFAVLFLSISLWWALGHLIGNGWSALVVAALWGIVGAVLYATGRKKLQEVNPTPERTVDTLKHVPDALKGEAGGHR